MLPISNAKISNSNMYEIWRSKRQQPPPSQWPKHILEREKSETLKETKPKSRPIEIISHAPEMNPDVKPFHPRNKGLARSEGLWQMYCNQPKPVLFDRPAKSARSTWPDAHAQAQAQSAEPLLPEQQESGKESPFRFYEESDFWGYFLPNTLSPEERKVSWGLSIPTDWQSPEPLSFPMDFIEDGMSWDYPHGISFGSDEVPTKKKSKLLNLFTTTTPDIETEAVFSEDPIASEMGSCDPGESKDTEPEIYKGEEHGDSCAVSVPCDQEIKTNVSCNFAYSTNDLLFGTPSRSESRKRRNYSGVSHPGYEGCKFYRSNSSPVLTAL